VTNNDILRRFRYALDISNPKMLEIFRLAGHELDQATLVSLLKKEEEEGFQPCSNGLLEAFLDGLIILKRGPREGEPVESAGTAGGLNNNVILRKLRIALEMRDDDMVEVMKLAGAKVTRSELGAFFRSRGHKNYKECGDQFLRNFLKGLTNRYRA